MLQKTAAALSLLALAACQSVPPSAPPTAAAPAAAPPA